MRGVLALAGLAAIGCQSESELQYRSTVAVQTDGVAMADDGLTSYAAMAGTTCALDLRWGCPTDDEDLPTERESVLDHYQGVTLARSDVTLHFLHLGIWDPSEDLEVPALRTARLSDAGVLALRDLGGDCRFDVDGVERSVDASLCAAREWEVDRRGALLAVTDAGIVRVDAGSVLTLAARADRVSVDAIADRAYVATAGQRTVSALDRRGQALWQIELASPVRDLVARGERGDLVVLTEESSGLGVLTRLSGEDGAVRSSLRVPAAEGRLVASANGRGLALVTDDEVHHFEVVVDGEEAPIGREVTCDDMPVPDGGPNVGLD